MRRLCLVTDAWHPQTNGVVNTLVRLVSYLESQGTEVLVIAPDAHRTVPLPNDPDYRLAYDPWRAIPRIRAFEPDAIHVATEGPLGMWVNAWLRRRNMPFTSSFHTRFPEYIHARFGLPVSLGYCVERWFHRAAEHTFVGTRSLIRELDDRKVGQHLVHWPRGVDTALFSPEKRQDDLYAGLVRPIWLYVGRVAAEKSLSDFLSLPLLGTKVVVGEGPSRAALQRRYPEVVFRGWRFGNDLAAHFASADCFVFPSRTETFGNVILEALASGLPVASVPAPGPIDLLQESVNGAVDEDLLAACQRALRCDPVSARTSTDPFTFRASHEVFRSHLVPLSRRLPAMASQPDLVDTAEPQEALV